MKYLSVVILIAAGLILAACQGSPTPTEAVLEPTEAGPVESPPSVPDGYPAPGVIETEKDSASQTPPDSGYPSPGQASPPAAIIEDPTGSGYPAPGGAAQPQSGTPVEGAEGLNSIFPALEADRSLTRGNFIMEAGEVRSGETIMTQAEIVVRGSLPTPCHELRAVPNPPDAQNRIVVDIYTVVDAGLICTQNIVPFNGVIATLDDLPSGEYTVLINDQEVGKFSVP